VLYGSTCTERWFSCVFGDLGEFHIEEMEGVEGGPEWLGQVAGHHVGDPGAASQCFLHVFLR
jgi:hypothetical protein